MGMSVLVGVDGVGVDGVGWFRWCWFLLVVVGWCWLV